MVSEKVPLDNHFSTTCACTQTETIFLKCCRGGTKNANIILWHLIQNKKFRDFNPKSKIFKKV